jgi:hypothetical protein
MTENEEDYPKYEIKNNHINFIKNDKEKFELFLKLNETKVPKKEEEDEDKIFFTQPFNNSVTSEILVATSNESQLGNFFFFKKLNIFKRIIL